MIVRVAIYARYSDDRQNPRSCDDQIAELRRHAERRGWTVTRTYQDDGISGFALANRDEATNAFEAGLRREFDVLLIEDLSRLGRNLGHLATMRDQLAYAGVKIATPSVDEVEIMHVAFNGAFAQQYLVDLGLKTARGMRANAERGLATGSRLYGYRTQPGGATEIVEAEADVIRRACLLYAEYRLTPREIADALNKDRVPGPRGGFWNASTIIGSRQRGNGLLRTELYGGVKVWNRTIVGKDPSTGKRTPTTRPPAEWKRTPVEHLRIVPAELWAQVQARLGETAHQSFSQCGNRAKPGLFSGLLKCGVCGGSYTVYNRGRLVCTAYRERGSSVCSNSKIVDRALVEGRALEGIRTRMLSPAAVERYVRSYQAAWARVDAEARQRRAPLDRRLGELNRSIARLVGDDELLIASPALRAKLAAQEAEKAEIELQLADDSQARPAVAPHPGQATAYAKMIELLQATIDEISADPLCEQVSRKLVEAARGLIVKIEIVPNPRGKGGVDLRLHGDLSRFMRPEGDEALARAAGLGGPTGFASRTPLVAGGGIEPPTCGL